MDAQRFIKIQYLTVTRMVESENYNYLQRRTPKKTKKNEELYEDMTKITLTKNPAAQSSGATDSLSETYPAVSYTHLTLPTTPYV